MHIHLHYVGALLNFYTLNNHNLHDNVDVKSGLLWAFRKSVNNGDGEFVCAIEEGRVPTQVCQILSNKLGAI